LKRSDERPSGPKKPLAGSAAQRLEAIVEGAEQAAEKVIDEAEEQARAYVAEAEADADRAVGERLAAVGELADALLAQADAIRRQAELLGESLREAGGSLREAEPAPDAEEGEAEQPQPGIGERRTGASPGAPWRLGPAPETRSGPAPEPAVAPVEEPAGPAGSPGPAPRAPHLTPVDSARPVDPGSAEGRRGVAVDPAGGTPAGARLLATQMAVSGASREEIAARLRSGFQIDDTDGILDAILGPES
jgi:vacuolar-type H+-ATPase subunit H